MKEESEGEKRRIKKEKKEEEKRGTREKEGVEKKILKEREKKNKKAKMNRHMWKRFIYIHIFRNIYSWKRTVGKSVEYIKTKSKKLIKKKRKRKK